MPDLTAVAVTAVFALVTLIPLGGRSLLRPLTVVCLLFGAATWFLARESPVIVWDEGLGPLTGLSGPPWIILRIMVGVAIGEVLKATAPLAAVSLVPTDAPTAIAYGAAAGAGFSILGALPVVARTLQLIGSPIVSPFSTAMALLGWFFVILSHATTTALISRAGVRGGLGVAFFVAWLLQVLIELADAIVGDPIPGLSGITLKLILTALIASGLLAYLWIARTRSGSAVVIES